MRRLTSALFDLPLKDPFSCCIEVLAAVASSCATQIDDGLSPGRCPPSTGNNQQMGVRASPLARLSAQRQTQHHFLTPRRQTAINTTLLYPGKMVQSGHS